MKNNSKKIILLSITIVLTLVLIIHNIKIAESDEAQDIVDAINSAGKGLDQIGSPSGNSGGNNNQGGKTATGGEKTNKPCFDENGECIDVENYGDLKKGADFSPIVVGTVTRECKRGLCQAIATESIICCKKITLDCTDPCRNVNEVECGIAVTVKVGCEGQTGSDKCKERKGTKCVGEFPRCIQAEGNNPAKCGPSVEPTKDCSAPPNNGYCTKNNPPKCEENEEPLGGNGEAKECGEIKNSICCVKPICANYKPDTGSTNSYDWAAPDEIDAKCEKTDSEITEIVDKSKLSDGALTENSNRICCKTRSKEEPSKAAAPAMAGGDLFTICFGQIGDIWTKGYALMETTDEKKVEEIKGKGVAIEPKKDLSGEVAKDKNGKVIYEYKVGTTAIECLANYMAIVYGAVTSTVQMTQGGDREIGSCSLEKPLPGSDKCKTCNEDPYRICTKERCQILGKCIALADNDTNEYRCESGSCEEKGDIELSKINASWYGDTEMLGNKASTTGSRKGTIKLELNEIAWNTKMISATITTTELAQCKYALDKPNSTFSEMNDFDNNYYPENRIQSVNIPIEGDISRNIDHIIYIKCNNLCNLPHAPSYDYNQIKFKLEKKPDQLPPEIIFVDPAKNSVVSSSLEYINASFWLDERGNCKFSDISINFTSNYNDSRQQTMIPFGQISPNPQNSSVEGGACNVAKCEDRNEQCSRCWLKINPDRGYEKMNSTNPEFNETRLYHFLIRCDDGKNIMAQDKILDYIIMTAPGYEINITKPEQEVKYYDDTPEIEVTSGTRNTRCKYKIYNGTPNLSPSWDEMNFIDEAFSTIHNGEHNVSLEGSSQGKPYTIFALCRDTWNIESKDKVTFFILKDTEAPKLIRTYHDTITGDFLTIETDEESTCAFSYTGCNFNFSQGNAMTGELQYLHSTYWRDKTFFIKCKDKWDNYPVAPGSAVKSTSNPSHDYCTAILKPFDIPLII
jgi:hypothetical protein